jgi:hypothetical protein
MKESWKLMSQLKLSGQTKDGPIGVLVFTSEYTDEEDIEIIGRFASMADACASLRRAVPNAQLPDPDTDGTDYDEVEIGIDYEQSGVIECPP